MEKYIGFAFLAWIVVSLVKEFLGKNNPSKDGGSEKSSIGNKVSGMMNRGGGSSGGGMSSRERPSMRDRSSRDFRR